MKNSEYNETRKSILQADRKTINLAHLKRDIERAKQRLSKKRGYEITDTFGQSDIRRIEQVYEPLLEDYWGDDGRDARALLAEFDTWTSTYEGIDA